MRDYFDHFVQVLHPLGVRRWPKPSELRQLVSDSTAASNTMPTMAVRMRWMGFLGWFFMAFL